MLAVRLGWPVQRRIPVLFHRLARRALGVRVDIKGAPSPRRPLLLLSNHVSWVDIVVLGSLMPVVFVAKSEVADWPVFGLFARLQRSVFVERERRARTGQAASEIAHRLAGGDAVVLFAEGTTSDGITVLPFRSALLGATGAGEAVVQPVAITYTALGGLPIERSRRCGVAWLGETDLPPHLWALARLHALDVTVAFAPVLPPGDRKSVAAAAEGAVRRLVSTANAGR